LILFEEGHVVKPPLRPKPKGGPHSVDGQIEIRSCIKSPKAPGQVSFVIEELLKRAVAEVWGLCRR